ETFFFPSFISVSSCSGTMTRKILSSIPIVSTRFSKFIFTLFSYPEYVCITYQFVSNSIYTLRSHDFYCTLSYRDSFVWHIFVPFFSILKNPFYRVLAAVKSYKLFIYISAAKTVHQAQYFHTFFNN